MTTTTTTARAALAAGDATLREVARAWGMPMAQAYAALYGRPMPRPATPPATGRVLSMPRNQRRPRRAS